MKIPYVSFKAYDRARDCSIIEIIIDRILLFCSRQIFYKEILTYSASQISRLLLDKTKLIVL